MYIAKELHGTTMIKAKNLPPGTDQSIVARNKVKIKHQNHMTVKVSGGRDGYIHLYVYPESKGQPSGSSR